MLKYIGVFVPAMLISLSLVASEVTPKLVYLVVDDDRLIASNIFTSRFDEFRLGAKERIKQQAVANGVIVVVTNQRFIGYSIYTSSWRTLRTAAGEKLIGIEAEDFSALLTTSTRWLNFNGKSGVWAEIDR